MVRSSEVMMVVLCCRAGRPLKTLSGVSKRTTDGAAHPENRMEKTMRRVWLLFIAALLGAAPGAHAQGWSPQRNVEIVVPNVPGGTNDKLARAIERNFGAGKLVNSSLTVMHKPGGGNQIAYAYINQHAG